VVGKGEQPAGLFVLTPEPEGGLSWHVTEPRESDAVTANPFDPQNLAPSCRPCNLAKRYETGRDPTLNVEPSPVGTPAPRVVSHGAWAVQ
jgi:hypothetical protein